MMRLFCQLFCLFLLISTSKGTAQVIMVGDPSSYKLVDKDPWFFRAGDSTNWANPAYDAHHWTKIGPNATLDENPALWKTGRGWFRQTFRFLRLQHQEATITIRQFGKSEVYLDGRRIAVLTPAQYDSGGSQRIMALVPIRIADTNRHTLAVRYAFRHDSLLGAVITTKPFEVDVGLSSQAALSLVDGQRKSGDVTFLLVGIFSVLSLLHFLFYRANPAQRVHRVLAAMMLAFALVFLLDEGAVFTGTLTVDSVYSALTRIDISVAGTLLLLSLYTYLGRSTGWVFWGIVVLLAAYATHSVFIGPVPDTLFWIPFLLVLVEYIRVSWLVKRRNPDPYARLPWNSLKVTLYAMLGAILIGIVAALFSTIFKIKGGLDWLYIPIMLLGLAVLFSVPLGLSLSLVRDYTRTYLSLRQKLDEVGQLSAQTLRQEQEKQQLLARQNEMLEHQVADRTAELNQSLMDLRETQTQLIQREKLASLGELTAGIAHEIQNPLNFVNNFSEVSTELVAELREEREKGRADVPGERDEELEAELLGDLAQNLQKITHHGHRASSIVKGMLEHARTSTGERESTNLNALADEYLRLSYQGLRAKSKDFNATLQTDFDPNLPNVGIVSQDVGRVLLNLFNNAFYAIQEKQKTAPSDYKPTLSISTRLLSPVGVVSITHPNGVGTRGTGRVEIRISDNGTGIPDSVKQKIFQPFFTTKPTGEGTGLGLSLSYDIVTKGHGGTVQVESQEGEGTMFTMTLPITTN